MNKFILSFAVLAIISMSSIAEAQRPGGQRGGGEGGQQEGARRGGGERGQRGGGQRGGQRPTSPLMTALDVDKDGKLSAEEIANAATALKALDKNNDGILEATELVPVRGAGGGRPGAGAGGGRPGAGQGGGGRGGDPSAFVDGIMERDADKDSKISKEEAGERMAGFFDRMDEDKDGYLTREELEAMSKRWQSGGGGRGGNRAPQPKAKDNRPAFDDN